MKNFCRKVLLVICVLFAVTCGSFIYTNHRDCCQPTYTIIASAEEGGQTGTTESVDKNEAVSENADNNQQDEKKDDSKGKKKNSKTVWMIVISCIISLALAIFLAVRKANKVYGKGWD